MYLKSPVAFLQYTGNKRVTLCFRGRKTTNVLVVIYEFYHMVWNPKRALATIIMIDGCGTPLCFFYSWHSVRANPYTHFNQTAVCLINNKSTPSIEVPLSQQRAGTKKSIYIWRSVMPTHRSFIQQPFIKYIKCQGQAISLFRNTVCNYSTCLCLHVYAVYSVHVLFIWVYICTYIVYV